MQSQTNNQGAISLRNFSANFGDGTTQAEFGLINEIKLKYTPIKTGRDSRGRSFAPGYDVLIEFNMMQNDSGTLTDVFSAMASDEPGTMRFVKGTAGFEFENVKPLFEPEIDANGGVTKIKVSADIILTNAEMAGIIYSGA